MMASLACSMDFCTDSECCDQITVTASTMTTTTSTRTSTTITLSNTMTTGTLLEGAVGASLTKSVTAGAFVLYVTSTGGFALGDALSIGAGADMEVGQIASFDATSVTLEDQLKLNHLSSTLVAVVDMGAAVDVALKELEAEQKREVSNLLSMVNVNASASHASDGMLAQVSSSREDGTEVTTAAMMRKVSPLVLGRCK
eukprot:TRINITY_DN72400_c0_g1_i1.p1 TRINITY_DN72400_c0_g1~~TRINITY_DN72400_c0_g1_i1.p1  ORF type:complete len:199 (-),score=34.75 TRINITY_DN72400_c0_g1_i1:209-805(-)